jgi:hypothetical protein
VSGRQSGSTTATATATARLDAVAEDGVPGVLPVAADLARLALAARYGVDVMNPAGTAAPEGQAA